ncbi:MAG: hypothetical protein OIF56_14990 [Cohaesibacter sp.]|nr:hypothetical protein [Cohaesibacter sp.]
MDYFVSVNAPVRLLGQPVVPGKTEIKQVDKLSSKPREDKDALELTESQINSLLRVGHITSKQIEAKTKAHIKELADKKAADEAAAKAEQDADAPPEEG